MALIECVPNVSEGRRRDVVDAIADAIRRTDGARLLDYSSDVSHNRSVFTLAGDATAVEQAVHQGLQQQPDAREQTESEPLTRWLSAFSHQLTALGLFKA
jgi:glutamate formiminotransferase